MWITYYDSNFPSHFFSVLALHVWFLTSRSGCVCEYMQLCVFKITCFWNFNFMEWLVCTALLPGLSCVCVVLRRLVLRYGIIPLARW